MAQLLPNHAVDSNHGADSKTILLTGGTGFLGGNLAAELLSLGYKVILLKRSFSDASRIAELTTKLICYDIDKVSLNLPFEEHSILMIIHCATNYGIHPIRPTEIIEANLILPLKLLELAKQFKVHGFINTDTLLPKGVNYYSLSKHHFSDWLQQSADDLVTVNVVLEHFYGPQDDPSKFVARIIRDIQNNVPEIFLTPGHQKRDFVYISDVTSAFVRILEHALLSKNGYERFEVGTGKSIPIREMVALVKKLAGNDCTRLNFGALPYRKSEPMDIRVDISKLISLGWNPLVTLEQGIARTLELQKARASL